MLAGEESGAAVGEALVVSRGSLRERLLLTGEVDAAVSVKLVVPRTDDWNVSIRWMAAEGTSVRAGDRVVEFDNAGVTDRIAELELAVIEAATELDGKRAEAEVAVAEKGFEVDEARFALAQAELDASVPEALVSRREARDNELALARARAELVGALDESKAAREGGRMEEKVARIAFEKAERALERAEQQLEALELRATRDGIVIIDDHPWEGRKLQVGDMVWPGMTVARLPDLDEMIVIARLSDVDEGRVTPGMRATCTVDAFPERPIAGFVRAVSPIAHQAANQASRRFFEVVVQLDAEQSEQVGRDVLRPGLSARVEILARAVEDALLVPRAALDLAGGDGARARVRLADGREIEVTLELCDAQHCAVAAGLSEGDRLVAVRVDA